MQRRKPYRKNSKHKYRFQFNTRVILEVVAIVMIWRGTWYLLDSYFFPVSPEISGFLGIVIGIVILLSDDLLLHELKH